MPHEPQWIGGERSVTSGEVDGSGVLLTPKPAAMARTKLGCEVVRPLSERLAPEESCGEVCVIRDPTLDQPAHVVKENPVPPLMVAVSGDVAGLKVMFEFVIQNSQRHAVGKLPPSVYA